ncbi:hypothetical protein ACFE04_022805 [Oxalis oulophora]
MISLVTNVYVVKVTGVTKRKHSSRTVEDELFPHDDNQEGPSCISIRSIPSLTSSTLSIIIEDAPILSSILSEPTTMPSYLPLSKTMLTVIGSESIILSLMTSSLPIGGTLFLESSTLSVSIEDALVLSSVLSELVTLPFSLPFPKAMLDVMGSDSTFLSLTIPSMLILYVIDLENMVAPSVYSTYGPLHTSLVASSPIVV